MTDKDFRINAVVVVVSLCLTFSVAYAILYDNMNALLW